MRHAAIPLLLTLIATGSSASDKKDLEKWKKNQDEVCAKAEATPGGQFYKKRFWQKDDTDIAKLKDSRTLTPEEATLLLEYKRDIEPCRATGFAYADRWAPEQKPVGQAFYSRNDEVWMKAALGEITVAIANRLLFESRDQFKNDMAVVQAKSAAEAEAARRAADEATNARREAYLRQLADSLKQPQTTTKTTNCFWAGNSLSCTTRQ